MTHASISYKTNPSGDTHMEINSSYTGEYFAIYLLGRTQHLMIALTFPVTATMNTLLPRHCKSVEPIAYVLPVFE